MTTLRNRAAAVLLVALLAAGAVPARADDAALQAALTRHGFEAVAPTAAADFELEDLDGTPRSLSGYAGRWVLLTFFASWCGPCRSELPSVQALHAEWHDDGLAVIGVGLDTSTESVRRLAESKGLTFPVLLDPRSRVGRKYRASAIPISYWIDPLGRVVGVARGARDWSEDGPIVQELLALIPPGDAPPEGYETAPAFMPTPEVVALPDHVVPPKATVSIATTEVLVETPFTLDVEVHWAGHTDDYMLHAPEVELPDGVTTSGTSAESSSLDGNQVVTYRIGLQADMPGRYTFETVDLQYTPRGGRQPIHSRIDGVTVEVKRPAPVGLLLGLGIAVGMGLGLGVALALRRRRGATEAAHR